MYVTGGDGDEGGLEAALTVARMFDSHVEALHTRLDPSESGFFLGGDALAASVPVLMEAIERDAEELSRRAREHFDRWRAAHAIHAAGEGPAGAGVDRKSPRLNSSH